MIQNAPAQLRLNSATGCHGTFSLHDLISYARAMAQWDEQDWLGLELETERPKGIVLRHTVGEERAWWRTPGLQIFRFDASRTFIDLQVRLASVRGEAPKSIVVDPFRRTFSIRTRL